MGYWKMENSRVRELMKNKRTFKRSCTRNWKLFREGRKIVFANFRHSPMSDFKKNRRYWWSKCGS